MLFERDRCSCAKLHCPHRHERDLQNSPSWPTDLAWFAWWIVSCGHGTACSGAWKPMGFYPSASHWSRPTRLTADNTKRAAGSPSLHTACMTIWKAWHSAVKATTAAYRRIALAAAAAIVNSLQQLCLPIPFPRDFSNTVSCAHNRVSHSVKEDDQ